MKKLICVFLLVVFNLTFVIPSLSMDLSFAAEYMLASGDQLEIKIIGQKELDTKQAIAPDGTISLPFLGRIPASGKTLSEFEQELKTSFSKYSQKPQIIVYLTPRPIYVIQHDIKKNVWEVKEAKSVTEAKALAGKDYSGEIKNGDIITVDVSKKADFFEDNWYKIITGTAVVVGIYATLHLSSALGHPTIKMRIG